MDITSYVISLAIAAIALGIIFKKKSFKLPGPRPLPFLGNLHQLNKTKLHVQLLQWAKQYGPVYHIWFGGKPVVVVTGGKEVHEVLVVKSKHFTGRSNSFLTRRLTSGGKDLAFSDLTTECKVQKKLFTAAFKGYGSGFQRIEDITIRYTNDWMSAMESEYSDAKGLDIKERLSDLTCNIITAIALPEILHTEENKGKVKELVWNLESLLHRLMSFEGLLLDNFPIVKFISSSLVTAIDNWNYNLRSLFSILRAQHLQYNKIENTPVELSENVLLSKLIQYSLGNNVIELDDEHLMLTFLEAFSGGILTTSVSFLSLFNILAYHKDIQEKIQVEINNVVGKRPVKLEDRENMPYVHATLLELLRFSSILPILVPHRSTTDSIIAGHHIPQDTEVWVNAWGLHHDDAIWDQPFMFVPERFIDASGAVVLADHPNRRNLVPFGAGLRVCAGETFAMSRMFLILTVFLQKFIVLPFSTSADKPTYDTRDMDVGLVLEPHNYKLKLQARV